MIDSPQVPESVWDYPRPPKLEESSLAVRVEFEGIMIARSERTYRLLETSHPPVFYIPWEDLEQCYFHHTAHRTFCEWKGIAHYYSIQIGDRISENAAWCYPDPTPAFSLIQNYVAIYPSRVDSCWVGDEKVTPQEGDFYGGWITRNLVGPFKGGLGTFGW
ncbi:MAG: DUF427 domain-containing protein [Acaryochloridaceae cyanobacterium RL_2_7]|nr:DUF427 domain-containing protein [Acaryochloridaceae cyanobacterium RL_2_7]